MFFIVYKLRLKNSFLQVNRCNRFYNLFVNWYSRLPASETNFNFGYFVFLVLDKLELTSVLLLSIVFGFRQARTDKLLTLLLSSLRLYYCFADSSIAPAYSTACVKLYCAPYAKAILLLSFSLLSLPLP